MKKIWVIKLYEIKSGYKVKIESGEFGGYEKVEAEGPTAHTAYQTAVWLMSLNERKVAREKLKSRD